MNECASRKTGKGCIPFVDFFRIISFVIPHLAESPVPLQTWNRFIETGVAPEKRDDLKNEIRRFKRLGKGDVKIKHLIGLLCQVEECKGLNDSGKRIQGVNPKDFPLLISAITKPCCVDGQDPKGNTFLLWASAISTNVVDHEKEKQVRLAKHLLSVGAVPTRKNKHGCSALECAKINGRSWMIALMVLAMPSVPQEYRNEALIGACYLGDPKKVELLLSQGADINAKDKNGYTPLMQALNYAPSMAASNKHRYKLADFLISKGADVDAKDKGGSTALHLACYTGDKLAAEILLSKGADINAKDKDGRNPLACSLVLATKHKSLADFLISRGADLNAALMYHVGYRDLDAVKYLVEKGADVNAKAPNGDTPLKSAEKNGIRDIVEFLKSKGAE
ncbi:ankyrin repeat domain-containing protein [Thermodesulfobacteriota bacterium]